MRWKWIVGIGVLLIVILIAGVYVYLRTYDYNKLKPSVTQMVEDATGRELHLGGEINLAIGLTPSLVVTDVAFANAAWGSQPQMIKIRRLEAQVRLIPLLFKNVELKHIGLADVDVLLETDSKGQGNWDFTGGDRSAKGFGLFEPAQIDIDSIRIENLNLAFRSGKAGSEKRFTVARLDVAKQATGDFQALDLRTEYKGRPAVLTGTTGLIRNLLAHRRFPLQLSGKLANTTVRINGEIDDALNLQGIGAEIRLTGKNLEVLGHVFDIQLPKTQAFDVTAHLKGSKDSMRLDQIKGSLSGSGIDLAVSGSLDNLITFSGINLKLKSSGNDLALIQSVIGEKLPTTDQFEIQGQLTGSSEALALNEARATARRGSMSLTLSGGVDQLLTFKGIHLTLKASGKEVSEIGQLVEMKLPELGPFNASGKLSGSAKAISLTAFSAVIDQSDFKGLAKLEFFKRPKITLRLESSVIDFTALMKTLENDKQKSDHHNRQKRLLFSDDPLPFDVLSNVDADILLKARNMRAKDAQFKFGRLTLKLEDGNLRVDKLEATYKETKISGNLHIRPGSPPQVAINFIVQNLDLGNLLKETGVSDQVRAIVDIAAEGKSSGDSVHSLMAELEGSIGAVMGEGYLNKYLNLIAINLSQKVIRFWGRHKNGDQIKCAVVQFDIKKGIAESQAFVFDTEAGILTGEGQINLSSEEVNFLLVPKPNYPSLSLSTKLRVKGKIMDPKVRPDNLALLKTGAEMLSSLAIGPLGLLSPFVHLGAFKKHPCDIKSIGQLGLSIPAKE